MRELLLPWDSQPQEAVEPNVQFIGAAPDILLSPSFGFTDQANGGQWSAVGTPEIIATQHGSAYTLNGEGSSDALQRIGNEQLTSNVGTFALWLPRVGAPSTHGHVYIGSASPNVTGMQVFPNGRTAVFSQQNSGGVDLAGWFNSVNRSIVFVSNGSAATLRVYVDGRDAGHTFSSTPVAWGSGSKTIQLGRYIGGSSWDSDADISVALFTQAVWDADKALEFHQNPWQLFAPRTQYVPTSSGVFIPTLDIPTFVPGSVTSSGFRPRFPVTWA